MESHALPATLALGGPDARAGITHNHHYLNETKSHQVHFAESMDSAKAR